jgi:nitroreductase
MKDVIKDALRWRYAVSEFDTTKPLDKDLFETIIESGRLAPSSNGFEPWKFIVVDDPAVRQKLRSAAYDQPKVTEAPRLVVIAYRTDPEKVIDEIVTRTAAAQNTSTAALSPYRDYLTGSVTAQDDAEQYFEKQTYIALGQMLHTAALLKVDAGPMSGFIPSQVDEILGLAAQNLKSTTLLALGYRKVDATRPKIRQTAEEAIVYV